MYWDHKTRARPFQIQTFSNPYNPDRLQHMTVMDGMIDPNITIRHENVMPRRDPGYAELAKRDTIMHDRTSRVIHDYTGTPIIKVDQEGGIFDGQLKQGPFSLSSKFNQGIFTTLTPSAPKGKESDVASSMASHNMKGRRRSSHGGKVSYSQQVQDLQNALEVARVAPTKKMSDIDSTLSTRGLMQRKLYLMKMMLKNEKHANQIMKQKLDTMGKEMHTDSSLIRGIEGRVEL